MFFRNQKPHEWTFDERLGNLKQFRFEIQKQGAGALVTRDGCGAIIENLAEGKVKVGKAGVLVGAEIANLVSRGYQMFPANSFRQRNSRVGRSAQEAPRIRRRFARRPGPDQPVQLVVGHHFR